MSFKSIKPVTKSKLEISYSTPHRPEEIKTYRISRANARKALKFCEIIIWVNNTQEVEWEKLTMLMGELRVSPFHISIGSSLMRYENISSFAKLLKKGLAQQVEED